MEGLRCERCERTGVDAKPVRRERKRKRSGRSRFGEERNTHVVHARGCDRLREKNAQDGLRSDPGRSVGRIDEHDLRWHDVGDADHDGSARGLMPRRIDRDRGERDLVAGGGVRGSGNPEAPQHLARRRRDDDLVVEACRAARVECESHDSERIAPANHHLERFTRSDEGRSRGRDHVDGRSRRVGDGNLEHLLAARRAVRVEGLGEDPDRPSRRGVGRDEPRNEDRRSVRSQERTHEGAGRRGADLAERRIVARRNLDHHARPGGSGAALGAHAHERDDRRLVLDDRDRKLEDRALVSETVDRDRSQHDGARRREDERYGERARHAFRDGNEIRRDTQPYFGFGSDECRREHHGSTRHRSHSSLQSEARDLGADRIEGLEVRAEEIGRTRRIGVGEVSCHVAKVPDPCGVV